MGLPLICRSRSPLQTPALPAGLPSSTSDTISAFTFLRKISDIVSIVPERRVLGRFRRLSEVFGKIERCARPPSIAETTLLFLLRRQYHLLSENGGGLS